MKRFLLSLGLVLMSGVSTAREPKAPPHPYRNGTASQDMRSVYLGHYGETLEYGNDWVLHKPQFKDAIEIIRFHASFHDSSLAPRVVEESAFNRFENYAKLNLVQILVIPENRERFESLPLLRAAKVKELTEQGVAFKISDAPMPQSFWPKDSFAVFVSSPYRLYQLYTESDGKRFILTSGLELDGGGPGFMGVSMADDIVYSLGNHFELRRGGAKPPAETFEFDFPGLRWISLPLLAAGLILLVLPWSKQRTRPLACAFIGAAILSVGLRAISFPAAYWLSNIGRGNLVSPGSIGWTTIGLLLALLLYGSRKLERTSRWLVRAAALAAAALLVLFALAAQKEISSNVHRIATNFATFMFWIGLLDGAVIGLSSGLQKGSMKRGAALLIVLMFSSTPADLSAQEIDLSYDRMQARSLIRTGQREQHYRDIAIRELQKEGVLFNHQRVEVPGIVATDDPNDFAPRMFNLSLHPAHNNRPAGERKPFKPKGMIQRFQDALNATEGNRKDVRDLFDDKTGTLTARGREILAPLMDKNVHVREIVAHSWGAVLLNNAIRAGLINPPKSIIVVGVPDSDLLKWYQLGKYTGTNVSVYSNSWDMATKAANVVDTFKNLDIMDRQVDYNDGNAHMTWTKWGQNNKRVKAGDATMKLGYANIRPYLGNITGHGRQQYYEALRHNGILEKDIDTLMNEQDDLIATRVDALFEPEIQNEIRRVQELSRAYHRNNPTQATQSPLQALQPRFDSPAVIQPVLATPTIDGRLKPKPLQSILRDLRDFAVNACRGSPFEDRLHFYNVYDLSDWAGDDASARNLASGLDTCSRQLFYSILERARANKGMVAVDGRWAVNTMAANAQLLNNSQLPGYSSGTAVPYSGGRVGGQEATPPPTKPHDPEKEALRQLKGIEEDAAMRKRWGLPPKR